MSDSAVIPTLLCRVNDIQDPGSIAATLTVGGDVLDVLVVRTGENVAAYLNRCPHTGAPLDWTPGQFLSLDGEHIQCAMHAALFEIRSGVCIAGPCVGDSLVPVPLIIDDGRVMASPDSIHSVNRP